MSIIRPKSGGAGRRKRAYDRESLLKRLRRMGPREKVGIRWTGSRGHTHRLIVRKHNEKRLPGYELLEGAVFGCQKIEEKRFEDFLSHVNGSIEVFDPDLDRSRD